MRGAGVTVSVAYCPNEVIVNARWAVDHTGLAAPQLDQTNNFSPMILQAGYI